MALPGCASEPPATGESRADVDNLSEALTSKCWPRKLEPVVDPTNPDYGRVNCVMVTWHFGTDRCACDLPGFAPATAEQVDFARSNLYQTGQCAEACCEALCFCEFLQHEGDALAACQSRSSDDAYVGDPTGWCYIEPALGFGSEADVARCKPSEKHLIRLFPEEPRYNISAVLACIGAP